MNTRSMMNYLMCLTLMCGCPAEEVESDELHTDDMARQDAATSLDMARDAELDEPDVSVDGGGDVRADTGPDISPSIDADMSSTRDVPADLDAMDLSDPVVQILPLSMDDVHVHGPADATDIFTSVHALGDGRLELIVDSSDAAFTRSALFRLVYDPETDEPTTFERMELAPSSALVASPSVVSHGGEDYLYYIQSVDLYASGARTYRRRWDGTQWGLAQQVTIPGADYIFTFPRIHTSHDGQLVAAFRDATGQASFASSQDGVIFGPRVVVDAQGDAMAAAGSFASVGKLAYTYQRPLGPSPMISYYRVSLDGGSSWSESNRVTEQSQNVHDTTLVTRADGDIDLYYIYPASIRGFVLFRRRLSPDGELGPEQQLTQASLGEPSKPQVYRMQDGRVLVAWAEISARDVQGFPSEQRLVTAILDQDAPR